jgi:hypothetical protein
MQQPGSGQIKKPHKHEELCGFFSSKPKLFATYIFIINFFFEAVKGKNKKKQEKRE